MNRPTGFRTLLVSAAVIVATLTGCASPANREAMTPTRLQLGQTHDASVGVKTSGGAETSGMEGSFISDADLKAAIESAIAQNAVFKQVVQGDSGNYALLVSVVTLNRPLFGASFTVNLEAAWTLTKTGDRSIVFRKSLRSSHTATMGDAFAAVTRLRLAVEGAARKNIEQGLQEISKLKL